MCLHVVFLWFFFLFWFVCLLADLKKGGERRHGVGWERWEIGQDLGGNERGKTVIRIDYIGKIFSIKNKKTKFKKNSETDLSLCSKKGRALGAKIEQTVLIYSKMLIILLWGNFYCCWEQVQFDRSYVMIGKKSHTHGRSKNIHKKRVREPLSIHLTHNYTCIKLLGKALSVLRSPGFSLPFTFMDEEGTSRHDSSVTFPQEKADKSSNVSVTCFRARAYEERESDFTTWLVSEITRCPCLRFSTSWTVSTFGTSILSFTLAQLSIAFQLPLLSRFPEVLEVRQFPWWPTLPLSGSHSYSMFCLP